LTRPLWLTFLTLAIGVGLGLGIALGVGAPDPGATERAAAGAFGLLGLGVGSIALSSAVEDGAPAQTRRARTEDEPDDAATAVLVRLERSLRFGASTAGDFYAYLRPRLITLTRSCLADHGVALSDREGSIALLGEDAYALVEPDGAPPADRFGPGVSLERVRELVGRLEVLGADR